MIITKDIDNLGRIVISKEMRKSLGINPGDKVNIECTGSKIIITKHGEVDYKERINKALHLIHHNDIIDYRDFEEMLIQILKGE